MWFVTITFNNDDPPKTLCSDKEFEEWETPSSCQYIRGDFDRFKAPIENIANMHFYLTGPNAL